MCEYCDFETKDNKSRILGETDRDKGLNIKAWMRKENEIVVYAAIADIQGLDAIARSIKINYCPMCGRKLQEGADNV